MCVGKQIVPAKCVNKCYARHPFDGISTLYGCSSVVTGEFSITHIALRKIHKPLLGRLHGADCVIYGVSKVYTVAGYFAEIWLDLIRKDGMHIACV